MIPLLLAACLPAPEPREPTEPAPPLVDKTVDTSGLVQLHWSGEGILSADGYEGTESLDATGVVRGSLLCRFTWLARDAPVAANNMDDCVDAEGTPCAFWFAVRRTEGAAEEGDCAPFALTEGEDLPVVGYGYTADYRNAGASYGPALMYWTTAFDERYWLAMPGSVGIDTGTRTFSYGFDGGLVPL